MHTEYTDILKRIAGPPLWFDEHAVPRFDPFQPYLMANIYAHEAALVRIECQSCGHEFTVAFSGLAASDPLPEGALQTRKDMPLVRDHIRARTLHFGDPPNTQCCEAGPSMSSVPRRVLEYWVKPYVLGEGVTRKRFGEDGPETEVISDFTAMDWRREPAFEVDITPDWAL